MPIETHAGGSTPSPRMVLAQEFADNLGDGTIERVSHGAGGRKRFYRVTLRPGVVVEVHYPNYVVVNGTAHRSLSAAKLAACEAIKAVDGR